MSDLKSNTTNGATGVSNIRHMVPGQVASSAKESLGSQLHFEPILQLDEGIHARSPCYRIHPVWRTDKGDLLTLEEVLNTDLNRDLFFGSTAFCFGRISEKLEQLESISRAQIQLTMMLPTAMFSESSTLDLLNNFVFLTGLSPDQLVLEIQEKVSLEASEHLSNMLARLRMNGFRVAVVGCSNIDKLLANVANLSLHERIVDPVNPEFRAAASSDGIAVSGFTSLLAFAKRRQIAPSVKPVSREDQPGMMRKYRNSQTSGHRLGSILHLVHGPA